MMDEAAVREKLSLIEARFAGASADGGALTAAEARARIRQQLQRAAQLEAPVECQLTLSDSWSQKLFLVLAERYGLEPYRRKGQRLTTIMMKAPERFVQETLLPEFEQLNAAMNAYLDEVTDRLLVAMAEGATVFAPRVVPAGPPDTSK